MQNEHQPFLRQTLSFVRRGARMTEAQQNAWSEHSSKYLVSVKRGLHDTSIHSSEKRSPLEIFGHNAPVVVEVGTGKGEAIVHAASMNRNINFLGVEVFRAGLARTILSAAEMKLSNLKLIEANAPEVFETLLPEGTVHEVRIYFPDPWHKKKHTKRRLISPEFINTLQRALIPQGVVRLATDWQHYAQQMKELFDAHPAFERDFNGEWAERFEGRPLTSFERKGQKAGREIRDLKYIKVS